jgi:hypothetical protein
MLAEVARDVYAGQNFNLQCRNYMLSQGALINRMNPMFAFFLDYQILIAYGYDLAFIIQ